MDVHPLSLSGNACAMLLAMGVPAIMLLRCYTVAPKPDGLQNLTNITANLKRYIYCIYIYIYKTLDTETNYNPLNQPWAPLPLIVATL